jgi:hypothetical protein
MREHDVNQLDNFIGGWYLDDTSVCDKIMDYHKLMETIDGATERGIVSTAENQYTYLPLVKDSVDCVLNKNTEVLGEYGNALQKVLNLYMEKYPRCNMYDPFNIRSNINIQKYHPGGGYHAWHTERNTCKVDHIASRHLVFMTYLNDVTDQGETEFWHQKVKIKPEKGLTLIWPADWTFTHRGIASPTEIKYIVTGWFNYA